MPVTDSISDILAGKWDEPGEIGVIKDYIRQKAEVAVSIRDKHITISVAGAALAGTLRMHLHDLEKQVKTDKKISYQDRQVVIRLVYVLSRGVVCASCWNNLYCFTNYFAADACLMCTYCRCFTCSG